MFSSISWHQYWQFIAISSLIYYASLIILYRQRWLGYLTGTRQKTSAPMALDRVENVPTDFFNNLSLADEKVQTAEIEVPDTTNEDAITDLEEGDEDKVSNENLKHIEWITNCLSDGMAEYSAKGNKEELILKLAQILNSDPKLSDIEPFREALDWHISQQAKTLCQIELLDTDNNRIWKLATQSD